MDKEDKLIEGHRFIRNFQREERKEEDIGIKDFKWKELGIVKKQLLESMEDLKLEVSKTNDEKKQMDIVEDLLILKHYISQVQDIEKGFNQISEKYGWNKYE